MTDKNNKNFNYAYALSLLTQVGIFISIVAIVFILGGKYADEWFHTSPLFLMIGLILSLIVNAYGVYQMLKPLIKNNQK